MSKIGKIFFGIIITIFILCGITLMGSVVYYYHSLKPVKAENDGSEVSIEIKEGSGVSDIAKLLEDNEIIQNAFTFKVYMKLNNKINLQAGKYVFNNGTDNVESIIKKLNSGEVLNESIKITFIEGKNMRYVAKTIAENTNNTEEQVFETLKNKEFLNKMIEKYWFLTDEILVEDIYYSLEGYLLPDTYTFENKDISVEDLLEKILEYTDKYLTSKRDDIEKSGITVHQMLTLASIAELEGYTFDDKAEIVGVFYNRLAKNMSLGSDVTTYYAVKKELSSGDLTQSELKVDSPYNTRSEKMAGYLPIGPISNPSKESIDATIDYKKTEAFYFVSDRNQKIYFTKTYQEHQDLIKNLKDAKLWFTY